ncbi:MAG: hypothetical protein IJR44_05340 [Neisseriaceae bacterium]|nr:hypothetical protein [Neisseriaceae bacterium]
MSKIIRDRNHPKFEETLNLVIKNIQDKGGKIDNLEAFKRDVERIEFVDGKVEITFKAA